MNDTDLPLAYQRLKSQAEILAGGLTDIPRRVAILASIYLDSGRNHAFSQMAAHGALWALGYFEAGGSLGRLIAKRYFYNRKEKAYRLGILREFAEGFRAVNRQVCIDTYANYHFARQFGDLPDAADVIPAGLLDALNRVHHARRNGTILSKVELKQVFEQSFHCEQEVTVAPGVTEAVAKFDCRIMRTLCLHPIVRFAYFPRCQYLFFRDFSDQQERIIKGMRAYDLAERVGWDQVWQAMEYYGQMPHRFFAAPLDYFREIQDDVIRSARVVEEMGEEFPKQGG